MKKVSHLTIKDNPIDEFKNKWALVTARKKDGTFNMCTIAWGSIGELWSKDVITVYVKENRYTNSFLLEDDYFTVSFFDEKDKGMLAFCGSKSGRDVNKVNECGLKVVFLENGITFENARRVYLCKKLYQDSFKKENFVNQNKIINTYYKDEPFHYFYIGEILETYEN